MASDEHLPECPHEDYECEGEALEGVEGGGMLAGAQQTCPVPSLRLMGHGPLTAGKHHDCLNQDKPRVQFTHLNTSGRPQMSL